MKIKIPFVGLAFLVFLVVFVLPVLANSSNFLPQATEFYNKYCTKKKVTTLLGISCYLYDKVGEHDIDIGLLKSNVDLLQQENEQQSEKILELENRLKILESTPIPTPTPIISITSTPSPIPAPIVLTFADNIPINQQGPGVQIPSGYKSITLRVTGLVVWAPQGSFDGGATFTELHRLRFVDEITIPIYSNWYRISPGVGASTYSATGTLNEEPGAQVLLFGNGVNYPFTSSTFDSTGYASIVITASGGTGPGGMTGISLQRFEGGSFVEKQHINCDGGAECSLTTLPLIGGDYHVVLQGGGTGAIIGAILRP